MSQEIDAGRCVHAAVREENAAVGSEIAIEPAAHAIVASAHTKVNQRRQIEGLKARDVMPGSINQSRTQRTDFACETELSKRNAFVLSGFPGGHHN